MLHTQFPYRSAPEAHLRHLVFIRSWLIGGLWAAIIANIALFQLAIFYLPIVGILTALTLINGLTWLRMGKSLPVTDIELFIQLLLDVFCLCTLVYFAGGANNPLISYLLVPVCIASATLTTRLTWVITSLCVISYSLLLFFHFDQPGLSPHHHSADEQSLNLHIAGMWVIFLVSALLISYFVNRMANNLRIQTLWLNKRQEEEIRDEQLMAVATLAAGTAHELGTPLSTIKVLLHEMQRDPRNEAMQEDLDILSDQVEQCSSILRQLVAKADQQRNGEVPEMAVEIFCQSIIEQWKLMRPEVTFDLNWNKPAENIRATFDPTIRQSVLNLLHNAADANPKKIHIDIQWDSEKMKWIIDDNGPGIPLSLHEQLGKAFVTSRGKGLGIGFFLTNATVNRHGGEIRLFSRSPVGTRTELLLPIDGKLSDDC